jgi:hypothetical protein
VLQPPAIGQSNALECIRIEQVREVADRIGERDPTSHPCHLLRQPDLDAARARLRDETGEVARVIRHLLRRRDSGFQFTFELVEEAPVGALGNQLVRTGLDHPRLVQAQSLEPQRVLGVVLAPAAVRDVGQRLKCIIVSFSKPAQ